MVNIRLHCFEAGKGLRYAPNRGLDGCSAFLDAVVKNVISIPAGSGIPVLPLSGL
jgi:hypothetical protein